MALQRYPRAGMWLPIWSFGLDAITSGLPGMTCRARGGDWPRGAKKRQPDNRRDEWRVSRARKARARAERTRAVSPDRIETAISRAISSAEIIATGVANLVKDTLVTALSGVRDVRGEAGDAAVSAVRNSIKGCRGDRRGRRERRQAGRQGDRPCRGGDRWRSRRRGRGSSRRPDDQRSHSEAGRAGPPATRTGCPSCMD
jgi:hypothetical protein